MSGRLKFELVELQFLASSAVNKLSEFSTPSQVNVRKQRSRPSQAVRIVKKKASSRDQAEHRSKNTRPCELCDFGSRS